MRIEIDTDRVSLHYGAGFTTLSFKVNGLDVDIGATRDREATGPGADGEGDHVAWVERLFSALAGGEGATLRATDADDGIPADDVNEYNGGFPPGYFPPEAGPYNGR